MGEEKAEPSAEQPAAPELMVRRKKNKDSFTNEERGKKRWQAGIKESEGEKYSCFSLGFL
jgi:hypothetical protein